MKTSTKLIISAIIVLIISMGIYNSALKAEFLTGNYKKAYHNFKPIGIKGFTEVEINGANLIDVEFKQGDYAVYNSKFNSDSVLFTKIGNRLIINIDLKKQTLRDTDRENGVIWPVANRRDNRITIICPRLTAIVTGNKFTINGIAAKNCDVVINSVMTDRKALYQNNKLIKEEKVIIADYNQVKNDYYNQTPELNVRGFKLDSLMVIANGNQKVTFENCYLGNLKAVAGPFSSIAMGSGLIKSANLQIKAGAQLVSSNMYIPQLVYQISDSARVNLSGVSLKSFIKK